MPSTEAKLERAYLNSNLSAVIVAFIGVVCYAGIGWHHQYVFTPESMKEIAVRAIADSRRTSQVNVVNKTSVVENVVDGLRAQYGDYIFDSPAWMLNNAGGAMGAMLVRVSSAQLTCVCAFGSARTWIMYGPAADNRYLNFLFRFAISGGIGSSLQSDGIRHYIWKCSWDRWSFVSFLDCL
jgi:hypothetical protein